jgi:hypothetical protein
VAADHDASFRRLGSDEVIALLDEARHADGTLRSAMR